MAVPLGKHTRIFMKIMEYTVYSRLAVQLQVLYS